MREFIKKLKTVAIAIDPMPIVGVVLIFSAGVIAGQQTASHKAKKHYLVDASEVEVVYHDPYKALTLTTCATDWECETARLIADNAEGKLISTDDPIFFPSTTPVIEPIDCKADDKACEAMNKNVGKPAHYPAVCEPYIYPNPQSENPL